MKLTFLSDSRTIREDSKKKTRGAVDSGHSHSRSEKLMFAVFSFATIEIAWTQPKYVGVGTAFSSPRSNYFGLLCCWTTLILLEVPRLPHQQKWKSCGKPWRAVNVPSGREPIACMVQGLVFNWTWHCDDMLRIGNMDTHQRTRKNVTVDATQNAPTHHTNEKKVQKRS